MKQGIILPNMKIYNFNCEQNSMVIADTPSITAIGGFVHNLLREYTEINSYQFRVLIHSAHRLKGHELFISEKYGQHTTVNVPLVENIQGDCELSIVIYVNGDMPFELQDNIFNSLKSGRLAGGNLFPYSPHIDESVLIFEDSEEYHKNMRKIKGKGLWLADFTDKLDVPNKTQWDVFKELIFYSQKYLYKPAAIGYAAVTDKYINHDLRKEDTGTIFAEPLTGIIRFIPYSKYNIENHFIVNMLDNIEEKYFLRSLWKFDSNCTNMFYRYTGCHLTS